MLQNIKICRSQQLQRHQTEVFSVMDRPLMLFKFCAHKCIITAQFFMKEKEQMGDY